MKTFNFMYNINFFIKKERFMEKRLLMFLAGMFLSIGMALAQTQVKGTVVSSSDGEPVVGASVVIPGTKTGFCLHTQEIIYRKG